MHFVSALAYPCDLSLRTENLVHKNTVQYKCVFFSLKPELWSHRYLGSKRHPPLPMATPAIIDHCVSLTNTENKWFYPLSVVFNAGQLQSSGFRILALLTATPSYVWHHHFYIYASLNLGTWVLRAWCFPPCCGDFHGYLHIIWVFGSHTGK